MNIAKIITGAQIALIGLIAFWAVRAVMTYFTPQSAWIASPQQVQPLAKFDAPLQSASLDAIDTSFDPFHRVQAAVEEVSLGEDAPETTLDLTLVGRRSGKNGTAILRTSDGRQSIYRINDEVLSGVTLKAVNVDYIVISQEGRLERLTFAKSEGSLARPKADASGSDFPPLGPEWNGDAADGLVKKTPYLNGSIKVPSEAPSELSAEIHVTPSKKSPKQNNQTPANAAQVFKGLPQDGLPQGLTAGNNPLSALLNFTPQRENNQVTGYKITPKQAGFNTAAFGLQSGDVITHIGGTSLQSENVNFGAILARLQGGNSATVDLIRNGQAISVEVGRP